MDIPQIVERVLSAEGATLPLLLVAGSLAVLAMALYVVILLVKRQRQ